MLKVAIIGSGISGLTCAYQLDKRLDNVDITVYEKGTHFGGHTDTHQVDIDSESIAVDTGFIVFNHHNYPLFSAMLDDLGVDYQPSDMSFSVDNAISGLSYNPSQGKKLLTSPLNFLKSDFRHMLSDLIRFYKTCCDMELTSLPDDLSLVDYLQRENYSEAFAREHLYPMAGALWSMDSEGVKHIPLKFALGFFQHHKMLQVKNRPQWLTVKGGSNQYIKALKEALRFEWRLAEVTSVSQVQTSDVDSGVFTVSSRAVNDRASDKKSISAVEYDKVIFACHADQALKLIASPSRQEQEVLSQFAYSDNKMVLHSDASIMPKKKGNWASWTVSVREQNKQPSYCITYWMNLLQNLKCKTPMLASLNPNQAIDESKIHVVRHYRHPLYHSDGFKAQERWHEINHQRNLYFCGAYWGWGFHEDGARSAHKVIDAICESPQHGA